MLARAALAGTSTSASAYANRGRIQIQGSGVNNVSQPYNTDNVVWGGVVSGDFAALYSAQSATQKARVVDGVWKAQVWVSYTCPVAGGCYNPGKSGMTNDGVSGSVARADAEVSAGKLYQ